MGLLLVWLAVNPLGSVALWGFPTSGSVPIKCMIRDKKATPESSRVPSLSWASPQTSLPKSSSSWLPVKMQCQEEKMVVTVQRECSGKESW